MGPSVKEVPFPDLLLGYMHHFGKFPLWNNYCLDYDIYFIPDDSILDMIV